MEIRKIKSEEIGDLQYLFQYKDFEKYKKEILVEIQNHIKDIYILKYDNKIIGEITVYYKHNEKYKTIENIRVYLSAYRIMSDYQNKGFGQQLLKSTIEDLENKGYTEFTIGVEDDNVNSKYIYEKFGFNEIIDRCSETYENNTYEYNLLLKKSEEKECN